MGMTKKKQRGELHLWSQQPAWGDHKKKVVKNLGNFEKG